MLERKYAEATKEADAAQLKAEKAQFDLDVMKRDKSELEQKNKEMEFDLNKVQQRLAHLESTDGDNAEKLAMQYEALQEMDRMMVESESEMERLRRALDFERKCR